MSSRWRWTDFVPGFLGQGCGGTGTSQAVGSRDRPKTVGVKVNEGDIGTQNNIDQSAQRPLGGHPTFSRRRANSRPCSLCHLVSCRETRNLSPGVEMGAKERRL